MTQRVDGIGHGGCGIERRTGGDGEAFDVEQGVDETGREEALGRAVGELGAVSGDGVELALPDGTDVEGDVGVVGRCTERWGRGVDGLSVGTLGHASPLREEEFGRKEGVEQTGRVREGVDRGGEGGGEGEVVGMAVCAVGAEGDNEVGIGVGQMVGEELLEVARIGCVEAAVGEVKEARGTEAERRAGGFEFGGADGGEGEGRVVQVIFTAFASSGAEEMDGGAGVGGEGEQAGKGVALIIGVGDNGEQA